MYYHFLSSVVHHSITIAHRQEPLLGTPPPPLPLTLGEVPIMEDLIMIEGGNHLLLDYVDLVTLVTLVS